MSLKEQINISFKDAMKAKDDVRKVAVRSVIAGIKEFEINNRIEAQDADYLRIIQKEVKSRKETIADAEKASRPDLIDRARLEMTVLESFLPAPFNESQLTALVKDAISETGAASPADIGKVMKVLMPKTQGRADGSQVSSLVRKLLGG